MTDKGSKDWLRRGEGGVVSVPEALVYLPLLREATCAGGLEQPKTLSQVLRAKYRHSRARGGRIWEGSDWRPWAGKWNGMATAQHLGKPGKPPDNRKGD